MTLNYLGKYDNLSLLWEAHPNGGIEGEYCYVGDQLLVWDKYENDWVEGSAEVLDVIPSDQPERESNNGLNCIGCFESEQQLWSQHPQGGVEGDYVVIAGKEYIWDKYNKEWREATEEDAAHFTAAVIVQDEAYEYSRLAITFMGSFEDISQIWKVYPQGGIEGGYIYLGEDKYIWDKYSYSWKPFEPTESSKLRPIDVTYTEGVVAYSEDYINYIGTFDNLDQVWEMYPNGGKDGDYILVNGERLKWNKYTSNWGEDESGDTSPARSVATIYGDLHVFNDLVIGEGLYARILEELSKKQWVQDNFTTKQWLLDQNYARQEWVLDQYKVLQDWVDQRNADIAKWILERNYISEGDISSETVMNLIETDEITITKKDGVLVAIASGGQGGTVLEPVNFEKGIRIGGKDGIEIIYDIENNALCFGGNAYSLGGMTAGGVGSGGSGGGGGISYNRLDSWSDYSVDKAGYVLSALLGKDLDNRVSALANAGYITASYLAPYALRSEIPSLDGYATLDALNTLSQTVVNFKSLFDSMFEKDSDGNIHAKLSLWSSGGITAGGVGSGGSGGGGISYNRLDSWSDYSVDKAGYVLSALLGSDLNTRLSSIENAGYITQSALAPYALRSEIPSLEGYATLDALNTLSQTVVNFKSLFDSMFEKDSDGNIHAKLSLWSSGGITAGGVGSGSSGGGGISYNRLDSWSDYSADKAGYVLSALLGKDLDNRVSALANAGYITASYLAPYALRSEIPSLAGYATQSWVGENFLSKSGGTLTDALTVKGSGSPLTVHRTQPLASVVKFVNTDGNLGWLGVDIDKTAIFMEASGVIKKLLHSGNYADYITNSYLKSTLGISDWALASSLEWTAINGRPTKLSDFTDDVVNGNFLPINATAKDSEKFGGQVPAYYATASTLNTLSQTVVNFKSLFDSMFEKDSDGNIHAKLSLWSSGGITAGGVGSGSSGGGGISYNRLDSWADYSVDKAGYVLSALLGKDLDNRVSALANAGYITASYLAPYALRSEIPSLVGYATESFVTSRGYITASALSGYATQSWVEGKKYLTGITSAMVTTALGYTPYNSANFTKDNLKSTLGISDWALASVKPTYTASEVGALGVNGTAQSALKMTPEYLTDLNSAAPWRFFDMNTGYGSADGNKPNIAWVSGITGTVAGSSNYRWQLATTTENARPYFRQESKGNWNNWRALAFTTDIPTKLSQLTDDVVAGKYLLLSGGTLSGSNRDLLSLDTSNRSGPRITLYENGNLIALIGCVPKQTTTDYGAYFVNVSSKFGVILGNDKKAYITLNTDTMSKDYQILHSGNYADYALSKYGGTVKGSITAYSFIGNLTGNAGSATKLATSRTIWGQSFDGTQDITGALTAPAITTSSLTIGGATITYDSVNEALCINGNMYALGGITAGGAGISAYSSLETRVARLEQQLNIS